MELLTTYAQHILIGILAVINIFSFFAMAHDKRKSVRRDNTRRTPEGFMFFMATIFGGVGIYLGMLALRHKTRKWYFQLGIPLLILQNLATIYLVREILL